MNEDDLNDFTVFQTFFIGLFNKDQPEETKLDINEEIPNQIFSMTFSAVSTDFYEDLSTLAQNELDEIYPRKVLVPTNPSKQKLFSNTNVVLKTVKKLVIDQIVNISELQNKEARMVKFAQETEKLMIKSFSFKYLLNPNLLRLN